MPDLTVSQSVRWWQRLPIRLPGGLVYQFGQWYALGKDCRGDRRVGAGATPAEARRGLAGILRAVERSYDRKKP